MTAYCSLPDVLLNLVWNTTVEFGGRALKLDQKRVALGVCGFRLLNYDTRWVVRMLEMKFPFDLEQQEQCLFEGGRRVS